MDSPGTRGRGDAYGVSGTPTVFFNGGSRIVGTNPPPYPRYRAVIEDLLADSSQLMIGIRPSGGDGVYAVSIDLSVLPGETIAGASEYTVRALVYEDAVSSGGTIYQHVVRDVPLETPLTIGESGQSTTIIRSLDIGGAWKADDLTVVVWIQRDSDRVVLNAAAAKLVDPTPAQPVTWGTIRALYR